MKGGGHMSQEKKRILVIDDDTKSLKLLKERLEANEGYECFVAPSGEEGLKFVQVHKPDLVLLDIMMSGMDGLATLKRIKEIDKEIPVCMVTAVWSDEEGKRCFEAGAYDYITKPIDFENLKNAIFVKLFT